jgi:hypothetical protein
MRKADDHGPIRVSDFFKHARPKAALKGRLCEVGECSQLAFVSLRVAGNRRQVCLTHYEMLHYGFGKADIGRSA